MLTLEQIKNITFTKSMGGYKTSEVDDFIDQCADTVASLIEERNAANKKLEVLADKLVEYRNEEDSIRSALVNAQRLGDTILREANQKAALVQEDAAIKADKLVADAQTKAVEAVDSVKADVAAQQAELQRVKREVTAFKDRMLTIYKEHLSLIDLLPEEPVPSVELETDASAPMTEPAVEPENAPVNEPVVDEPVTEPVSQTAPVEEPAPVAVAASAPVQVPLVPPQEETEAESKSRFGELKFGEDYVIAEDRDDQKGESKGFFRRRK